MSLNLSDSLDLQDGGVTCKEMGKVCKNKAKKTFFRYLEEKFV